MFEISAELIAALDDAQMRELVARLCRAELRARGLPEAAVTSGGDQRAPDGGIDVRVEVVPVGATLDFVPSRLTGFQVKQEKKFGPADVRGEMAPKGNIRSVLQELADADGAYLIVNGGQSLAPERVNERRKAMRETAAVLRGAQRLTLDFYDGHRVSQWVNQHPGIVLWVLETLGRPHVGYRPWGYWCVAAEDVLIEDEAGRLEDRFANASEPLSLVAGIERLRDRLRRKPACVRLVGLSGTGKTRLAQALFDERVGKGALASDLAVYTDIGDSPTPPVAEVLARLMRDGRRAVLIVDNCPPDAHRSLAKELARSASGVGLLTIEYDIRDDLPEETEVYRLLPGSENLIDVLLRRHAPRLSAIDRERLAEWSAGNTRLALALARQVGTGESLSKLSDVELFDRLFDQRQSRDRALLDTAGTAALVYSFSVEASEGEDAELPLLAGLAGQTPADFFRHVEEMRRRDLVQRRGVWRAVLPQALAHHLARRGLDSVLPAALNTFIADAPPRLLKSFTRQLGHLHDSERAVAIAQEWLAAGGRLGDYARLLDDERAMFRNLAPIDPQATLRAIERSLPVLVDSVPTRDDELLDDVARLLHALAYETAHFPKAVDLLVRLCTTTTGEDAAPQEHFRQLFWVGLSGTLVVTQQRLVVIDRLLLSNSESERLLGLEALGAMLNLDQRTTSHRFDFGARRRNFGWSPGTRDEMVDWLTSALARLEQRAQGDGVVAAQALQILCERFPGLWKSGWITDALEKAMMAAGTDRFWPEGYLAVRRAIWWMAEVDAPDLKKRLDLLAEQLAPNDLVSRTRAFVLSDTYDPLIEESDGIGPDDAYRGAERRAEGLGAEAVADAVALAPLLPDLLTSRSSRIRSFGIGLARATDDPTALWEQLKAGFQRAVAEEQTLGLLRGFLAGSHERCPEATGNFLDDAVEHVALAQVFPLLQTAVPLDAVAVGRLHRSLNAGRAPVSNFENLAYGRATDSIGSAHLVPLIDAIAARDGGWHVAAEILAMRFVSARNGPPVDAELVECGRRLLERLPIAELPTNHSESLRMLAHYCLNGDAARTAASSFCGGVIAAARKSYSFSRCKRLITKLLEVQPAVTLDELIEPPADELDGSSWIFWNDSIGELVESVGESVLLSWLRAGPPGRFAALAAKLTLFRGAEADDQAALSSAAVILITHAPDRESVLDRLRLTPSHTMSSGSIAAVFDERRKSLGRLRELEDPVVDAWVARADEELVREADAWRSFRADRDERFE